MNTAAVILAAGRGSRMAELTASRPKCLLRLAGRTLLDWQLDSLRIAGIEKVLLVKGYRGEMLQGDFESVINPRWSETNMVGTLLYADDFMRRSFEEGASRIIVAYSDIVYHPDHVKKLAMAPSPLAITYDRDWQKLWELRFEDVLSDAETFFEQDGFLKSIGDRPKDLSEIQGQYMGLLKFSPEGWENVKKFLFSPGMRTDKLDMTGLLKKLLANNVPIEAVGISGKWCEADNENDLARYEQALEAGNWPHDWRVQENL